MKNISVPAGAAPNLPAQSSPLGNWQPIETYQGDEYGLERVDLWLDIPASAASMGWSDSFRVPDAYRRKGKWLHMVGMKEMELVASYITHWMPLPSPPSEV